jgi:hypothetical protein
VVSRGARGLHATDRGVDLVGASCSLQIRTLDAALVAPGRLSLLDFDDTLPPASGGMHFLLHDNVWGTSFPLWYENDARFRFTVGFSSGLATPSARIFPEPPPST